MYRNLSTVGLPLSGRPSELIELTLSFGFDGMDIDILDMQKQAAYYGVEHARRLMVSARLKSGCFHLPVRLESSDADFAAGLAELPAQLEVAAACECTRAVTTLAPGSDEQSFKDFFELHRTRLHTIGEMLAPHGMMLGLAIRPEAAARQELANAFIHTFEGLIGLVAMAHERIGAVVDAWAMHVTGESLDLIAKVPKGRIVEVRLSDAPQSVEPAAMTPVDRLMPGETGVIPMGPVIAAVAAVEFDGPATPYADRSTLAGRSREKIVRLAGERMEQAWTDAGIPIAPRWFAPVARDQFGRPLEELENILAADEGEPEAATADA